MVSCAAAAVMAHAKARFCSRIAVFLRRRAAKACGGVRLRSEPAASRRTPGRGQPFHGRCPRARGEHQNHTLGALELPRCPAPLAPFDGEGGAEWRCAASARDAYGNDYTVSPRDLGRFILDVSYVDETADAAAFYSPRVLREGGRIEAGRLRVRVSLG